MLHRPVPRRPDLFRRAPACIAVLVVLALGIAAATARSRGDASAAGGFSLVSASAERIRFRFEGEPAGGRRAEDGTLLFLDRVHPTAPVGAAAQLPLATTWIALPPGAPGHVSVRLLETEPVAWPEGTTPEERAALLAVLPPQGWTSEPASWMANVWGLPVRFLPVVPDGRGGLLQVRSAEFTVEPAGAARGSSGGPGAGALRAKRAGGRDPLEATYRSLCLNYDQSLAWRKAKAPRAKAAIPDVWFTSTPNPWIKVHVPRRGLYAVRGEDLAAAGIPLAQIEPATVRLFRPPPLPLSETLDYEQSPSWMTEVPVEITGSGVNLEAEDEIRFLGQGGDGFYDELFPPGTGPDSTGPDRHFRDPYDGTVVYWLTWGGDFEGEPRRIPSTDASQVTEPYLTTGPGRVHFEEDRFWEPRPKPTVPPGQNGPAWERFWWVSLRATSADTEHRLLLSLPDPVLDRPVRLRLRLSATIPLDGNGPWPDHLLRVRLNGTKLIETDRLADGRPWDRLAYRDFDTTGVWLAEGEQELRLLAPVHPLGQPQERRDDNLLLAWVEMDYTRRLIAHGDTLAFLAGGPLPLAQQSLELNGFSTEDVLLYDVTAPFAPVRLLPRIETEGGSVKVRFRADLGEDRPSHFLAAATTRLIRPVLERKVVPAEGWLRARTDAVQAIIVTDPNFRTAADALADLRRENFPPKDGTLGAGGRATGSVAVVEMPEIYDEFAFGRRDPIALRNFLQCADREWDGGDPEDGPAFVTLLGDAYFDYRDHLGQGGRNHVPTYEGYWDSSFETAIYSPQFGSDDFLFLLDPGLQLDLAFGRLPARTPAQAAAIVQKVRRYELSSDPGSWRGRLTLVADDLCQGTGLDVLRARHMEQTEDLLQFLPEELQRDKVYLYDFGTACVYDRKPLAAEALRARMNQGTLLVNFTGHGSDEQIADERVFELGTVPSLTNAERLFLFFTASCSVGKYDFLGEGLGEALLLHPGGGAIGVFSASAVAFSAGNSDMNQRFFRAVWPGRELWVPRPLGVATFEAKNGQGGGLNTRRYIYLGDPGTRLATPRRPVELSLHASYGGDALGDTLRRGMTTDLRGVVLDTEGQPDPTFDGDAVVRVYDSSEIIAVAGTTDTLRYEKLGAPIYRGEAAVENGRFDLRFIAPENLRTGRRAPAQIFAYVENAGRDHGAGVLPDLEVPEEAPAESDDRTGPQITVEFPDATGDDSPVVLPAEARIRAQLADTSGINITGLVGSRSVILQIEEGGVLMHVEDVASRVTFQRDFREGRLSLSLPASLAEGRQYDLVLRASDNRKNSSAVRIPFVLTRGSASGFGLEEVFVFPNPAVAEARFFGTLSGPAEIELRLYTLTGRRIWRQSFPGVSPARFREEGIAWDGRDADGDRLGNGVYLYKLTARPTNGGRSRSVEGKLVVSR